VTLDDALAIIDRTADRAPKTQGADEETLEALRFLWRFKREKEFREALVWFRNSLDAENDIGRSQNANANRNRIRWLLRKSRA
jgi:hypothetical protein